MKHTPERVFIAGGTGFLGYYSALLFLEKGCQVFSIALPDEIETESWFPKEIDLSFGDLFKMSEKEITDLLKDKNPDTFVYCLGPDDRITPQYPAYEFFRLRLVDYCLKICTAAKKAGIKRCVVLNSYFAYFDRNINGKLSKHHPYIRCRVEQAEAIIKTGENGDFDVMVLELPYIFGSMPGRLPIWKNVFIDRFKNLPAIFFPDGGTAAIHVTGVAEAVYAAACNGENGERYPVNSINIKYREMLYYMFSFAGINKKFIKLPRWAGYITGIILNFQHRLKGLQSGLDVSDLMINILSKDFFIDPDKTRNDLNYKELGFKGGVDAITGIREAMDKC